MEVLKIQSNMMHFKMVSKILAVSSNGIDAEAVFNGEPRFAGLEAMAQSAALHVRHSLRFERHAFLLSVQHCHMPAMDVLKGPFRVAAVLRGGSSEAFAYQVTATGPGGADFRGELLIGTRAYDDCFKKESLATHYQKIWDRLKEK
jgi:hypothetical protein